MNLRALALFSLIVILITGAVSTGSAGSTYSVRMPSSVDIPAQTVTIDGTDYQFSALGQTSSDGTFTVDATGPEGKLITVRLYNNDDQIVDSERLNGSGTVSFDASPLAPGTYLVALEGPEGKIQKVLPVVVEGYDVSISVVDSVSEGDAVTVNVSVTLVDSSSEALSEVTIAIAHDGTHREVTASEVGNDQYRATVTLQESGTYGIYAGARGTETIDGDPQLIGISDRASVTVSTPTETEGTGGGGQGSDPSTDSPTPTPTANGSPTDSPPRSPTATPNPTPNTENDTTTPTSEGVLTPNPTTSPSSTQTTVTTPLTASRWLILLLFGAAFARRVTGR